MYLKWAKFALVWFIGGHRGGQRGVTPPLKGPEGTLPPETFLTPPPLKLRPDPPSKNGPKRTKGSHYLLFSQKVSKG